MNGETTKNLVSGARDKCSMCQNEIVYVEERQGRAGETGARYWKHTITSSRHPAVPMGKWGDVGSERKGEVHADLLAAYALEKADRIENLASYAHAAWAGWMIYLTSKCKQNDDGSLTIPPWFVERWTRQMRTDYRDLPDGEKESDRAEAKAILKVLGLEV